MSNIKVIDDYLYIEQLRVDELVEKYSTPLYIYSYNEIIKNIKKIKQAFTDIYDSVHIAYASKAFLTKGLIQILKKEGLYLDVVSLGEYKMAIKSGFNPKKIEYNGVSKSFEELEYAIDTEVGRIIVDGLNELKKIVEILDKKKKKVKILFRLSPDVIAGGHKKISTGQIDTKFGLNPNANYFSELIEIAIDNEYIDFYGFHIHIGSKIYSNIPYIESVKKLLEIIDKVYKEKNYIPKEINIGGGYSLEEGKDFSYFFKPIMELIEKYYKDKNIKRAEVVIEPGRSIVENTAVAVYRIEDIKEINDEKSIVYVDGGMSDNPRVTLYNAKYNGDFFPKRESPIKKFQIVGNCCESGDYIIDKLESHTPKLNDLLCVYKSGAYHISMASNYNLLLKPEVIMVKDNKVDSLIKRQTMKDLMKNENVPYFLEEEK